MDHIHEPPYEEIDEMVEADDEQLELELLVFTERHEHELHDRVMMLVHVQHEGLMLDEVVVLVVQVETLIR